RSPAPTVVNTVRALVTTINPPAVVPSNRGGILRTNHAAIGAATTPPTNSPRITPESNCRPCRAHRNPRVAAIATASSEAATEPTTLRGSNRPPDNNVVVPSGPHPPPPVASTNPAISPSGTRNRARERRVVATPRSVKNANRNNTYIPSKIGRAHV